MPLGGTTVNEIFLVPVRNERPVYRLGYSEF